MTTPPNSVEDLSTGMWRKSSFSGSGTGSNCVQIAATGGSRVFVRDSKDPDGPILQLTRDEAKAFIRSAKAGEWDNIALD